jgi:hypothetical protein
MIVIPAKAGIHWILTGAKWIPAFAGMTNLLHVEPTARERGTEHIGAIESKRNVVV